MLWAVSFLRGLTGQYIIIPINATPKIMITGCSLNRTDKNNVEIKNIGLNQSLKLSGVINENAANPIKEILKGRIPLNKALNTIINIKAMNGKIAVFNVRLLAFATENIGATINATTAGRRGLNAFAT